MRWVPDSHFGEPAGVMARTNRHHLLNKKRGDGNDRFPLTSSPFGDLEKCCLKNTNMSANTSSERYVGYVQIPPTEGKFFERPQSLADTIPSHFQHTLSRIDRYRIVAPAPATNCRP